MPPPLLFELDEIDTSRVVATRTEIYEALPQRHEFMLLDGICYFDPQLRRVAAWKEIRGDDWWTRAHLPGRPLFPGILLVEAAAQMTAYCSSVLARSERFTGFAGLDAVKFREAVTPPSRLLLLGEITSLTPRRVICRSQGVINRRLVFEATITGMYV